MHWVSELGTSCNCDFRHLQKYAVYASRAWDHDFDEYLVTAHPCGPCHVPTCPGSLPTAIRSKTTLISTLISRGGPCIQEIGASKRISHGVENQVRPPYFPVSAAPEAPKQQRRPAEHRTACAIDRGLHGLDFRNRGRFKDGALRGSFNYDRANSLVYVTAILQIAFP